MKRLAKALAWSAAGLAVLAIVALALLYWRYEAMPERRLAAGGPNAVWLGHRWVGQPFDQNDYAGLAASLRHNRITDAFAHVGPLNAQGRIPAARYPAAAGFVVAIKRNAPNLRLHAWIGQVEKWGGGPLDLSDAAVRTAIVETASQFLDLGFDGIHYNIEPVTDGNPHLLSLLDQTRTLTQARGRLLSMATDELEPVPGLAALATLLRVRAGYWTEPYYRAVADRVDQVAVMMYDTALPLDWLYGSLVAWETESIRRLTESRATLFIGVPSYEERRWSFHPDAENVNTALRGIRKGIAARDQDRFDDFGVAIYANWTTDASEWRAFRTAWLGKSDPDLSTASP
ncbi:MAG: hypothetical protein MJE12_17985 [Alphaproteobacteria bacterium]|nr:hypothetical protein [Alphaproteobacteria bacterium]